MSQLGHAQTALDRSANHSGRITLESPDDTKFWQEHTHKGHEGEQADTIEFTHPYGFTNVVQPPNKAGKAEGVANYQTGDRSHGIIVAHGDRRYRLYKLEHGEVALHDDQGHQIHIARAGVFVSAPNSKKIVGQIMESDKLPQDAKMAQTAQIKQKVIASFSMDKNSFSVNHPSTINLTAPNININSGNVQFNK